MSSVSVQAKVYADGMKHCHRYKYNGPFCKVTNFSGVQKGLLPLSKEQWDKGMALSHKYKNISAW